MEVEVENTVSIGLAKLDELGVKDTVQSLQQRANDNLNEAKRLGKNQINWGKELKAEKERQNENIDDNKLNTSSVESSRQSKKAQV